MNPLARSILRQQPVNTVRLAYGVMASATTVNIEGDATAVEVPQLLSAGLLVSGDYVAIQIVGADALIIGKVGTDNGVTDFTPTWTNLTVGNGTNEGRYWYESPNVMHVRTNLTFGSTTGSIVATPSYTIPDGRTQADIRNIGQCWLLDASAQPDDAGTCQASGTSVFIYTSTVSSLTTSVPFTWTTSDEIVTDILIELVAV